jgi:ectoine hydroxylase-related dioxygenase (phytanoyl-CoA dioxygenase family)
MKHQLDVLGYFVVEDFLETSEVAQLRALTRQYPQQLKGRQSSEFLVTWDGSDRIQQILHAERLCPLLDRINRSENTLALLRKLYGFDIGLYHSKFILKDGGGGEIPWHQDFAYWSRRSKHPCQLNCMVYLDDADEENGCLMVAPGSHRGGLVRHQDSSAYGAFGVTLEPVAPQAVTPLPGRAGTAILFGPLVYHASGANNTTRPRHSYTTVYTNPLLDTHRDVYSRFFPEERIKQLTGPGPFGFCSWNYQRRALWQLAADHVVCRSWTWIEVTDRTYNDGSFEWLSAHKHPDSMYVRFERHPLVTSNRDDVRVRAGWLTDTLTDPQAPFDLQAPFGLVFLDCEGVANVEFVLRTLEPGLREGTVIVLDNFYNFPGWELGTYKAFQEFVRDRARGFDYLGRSPRQVAVRLTAGAAAECPAISWQSLSQRISYE